MGDLLADESIPAVLELLAKHPCRKDSSTGGGELGQRGRSGGGGDGRRGGASGVVTRALLVLGSLLCVFFLSFQNVYFPWCGLLLFSHVLSPWCSQLAEGSGGAAIEPDLRAGTADRNWMVCRHSLYKLNASMIIKRKKKGTRRHTWDERGG